MAYEYPFEAVDGHVVLLHDGLRYLLDTGAPQSASTSGRVHIAGANYPTGPSDLDVNLALIGEWIGTKIDALLGVDILNSYDLKIDPSSSTIVLSDGELPLEGQPLKLDQCTGIPIIEVGVANWDAPVRVFFDTGARLSYLQPSLARRFPDAAEEDDFYPGLGRFTTRTYRATLTIGADQISQVVGILPPELTPLLKTASTSGILGTALLETHGVCYAPRRRVLSVWRLATE